MPTYQLKPISSPNGLSFSAAWFDDEQHLWDDERLRRPTALAPYWMAPDLLLARPEKGITDVLFNPNAVAVSVAIRDHLSQFSELEFLPVNIRDHGKYFILHVVSSCELPVGANAVIPGAPGYNIVDILDFPPGFESPFAFFRVRQPANSAAGRKGSAVFRTYMNEAGAQAIKAVAGKYLKAELVGKAVPPAADSILQQSPPAISVDCGIETEIPSPCR